MITFGPVINNKQTVSAYDQKLDSIRTIITTPEQVDEFITNRTEQVNSATKKGIKIGVMTTALGTAIGAGINRFIEHKEALKIDSLLTSIAEEYSQACQNKEKPISCFDLLEKDKYKNFHTELFNHFSKELNNFKPLGKEVILKITKHATLKGAVKGGILAFIPSICIPFIKGENADIKITNEFIEANK